MLVSSSEEKREKNARIKNASETTHSVIRPLENSIYLCPEEYLSLGQGINQL